MSDETPADIAESVFKHNLKASENTRQLFTDHSQDDAERAILEQFDELMGKIQNEQQAEDTVMLVQRLAQGLQSERLANAAIKEAKENPLLVIDDPPQ